MPEGYRLHRISADGIGDGYVWVTCEPIINVPGRPGQTVVWRVPLEAHAAMEAAQWLLTEAAKAEAQLQRGNHPA